MRSRSVVIGIVLCVLFAGVAPASVSAATYSITSPSAVDVPDRTESLSGQSYTVTEAARVAQGSSVGLDVSAPSGTSYSVYLYNADQQIERTSAQLSGDDSTSFSTSSLSPGSYVAVVYRSGSIEALMPVIIEGYTVSPDHSNSVAAGADLTVTTPLTKTASGSSLSEVELVVVEADTESVFERTSMSDSGGEYATTVQIDEAGEYEVYVNVRGSKEVRGEKELLGFSDPSELTVTSDQTNQDESGSGSGGGVGGAAPEPSTDTPTATETPGPTDTPTPTSSETANTETMDTSTPSDDGSPATEDTDSGEPSEGEGADTTRTESDSSGASTAATAEPTTTETTAPVGALPILFSILLGIGVARRFR